MVLQVEALLAEWLKMWALVPDCLAASNPSPGTCPSCGPRHVRDNFCASASPYEHLYAYLLPPAELSHCQPLLCQSLQILIIFYGSHQMWSLLGRLPGLPCNCLWTNTGFTYRNSQSVCHSSHNAQHEPYNIDSSSQTHFADEETEA